MDSSKSWSSVSWSDSNRKTIDVGMRNPSQMPVATEGLGLDPVTKSVKVLVMTVTGKKSIFNTGHVFI